MWRTERYIRYAEGEREREKERGRERREIDEGSGRLREQRDARGFEHFEGLSRAWRTHIVRFYTRSA